MKFIVFVRFSSIEGSTPASRDALAPFLGEREDELADVHRKRRIYSRGRCLEPAASWNAARRPDPLTASQKLLLRVTTPPAPSPPSAPSCAFATRRVALLRRFFAPAQITRFFPPRLRASSFSPQQAGLERLVRGTRFAGWIIFRRRGITRCLFKESGRTPLSPSAPAFLSLPPCLFFCLLS